jgi:erythronate-4-phosphate dehydrogenase
MRSIKIVADNKIPFLKGVLEAFAQMEYYPANEITNAVLKDADALIIRTRTICNKELLQNTNVKFIATATIGYDHIDTEYCKLNNIHWRNAPGCNSGSVMQYIASVLIALSQNFNFKFSEKTMGIIGYGHVGSKVAKLANTLGFNVLINDPPLARAGLLAHHIPLDDLLKKSDIISLHIPLNKQGIDKTFHLVDNVFLNKLKIATIIINTSRGEICNEKDLKNALKQKRIKTAVLDVWQNEPDIDRELLELVELATPHIAGYSADGKANGTRMSVKAIGDFFGFRIEDCWPKKDTPLSTAPVLTIDVSEKSEQEIFSEAILKTYDVRVDNDQLRKSPVSFEKQRENYPIRREFVNYSLNINANKSTLSEKLMGIGFKLTE